jgi:hypothetical protein
MVGSGSMNIARFLRVHSRAEVTIHSIDAGWPTCYTKYLPNAHRLQPLKHHERERIDFHPSFMMNPKITFCINVMKYMMS